MPVELSQSGSITGTGTNQEAIRVIGSPRRRYVGSFGLRKATFCGAIDASLKQGGVNHMSSFGKTLVLIRHLPRQLEEAKGPKPALFLTRE